jgi:hypothetical protein
MEIEQEIAVLSARMRFAQEYSAAKGWNFADLKWTRWSRFAIRKAGGLRRFRPRAPKSRRFPPPYHVRVHHQRPRRNSA